MARLGPNANGESAPDPQHGTNIAGSSAGGSKHLKNRAARPLTNVKVVVGQMIMSRRTLFATVAFTAVLAFCTPALPKALDSIDNKTLRGYSQTSLDRGAPSLPVTSRILYRHALSSLDRGDWEKAREELTLAAQISGDYPDPLFTLARIDLLHGNPDFLLDLFGGFTRSFTSFETQAFLAANGAFLVALALVVALLALLVGLLAKYWQLLDHTMVEIVPRRSPYPPARWVVPMVCVALLLLRLGLAMYCAILAAALWVYMTRKEKGIVLALMLLISVSSYGARFANCLAPAIDPGSVTRRLALVNERGFDERTVRAIEGIPDAGYRAEKDFALGTLLYRQGDYTQARAKLLESVSLRKDLAVAYLNLGDVYFVQGDYDRALAGYMSSIEIDSTNAVAHFNIGQSYIKKLLFAQSGAWLERANSFGIDRYREAHPAMTLRNATVYEQGFTGRELWALARREAAGRDRLLLGDMLQPYLLFPFQYVWVLFLASIAAALLLGWRLPAAWRVTRCDSCRMPACPSCADTQFGILLCPDCASVIRGLTGVKVMEALLRHRRQRVAGLMSTRWRARTLFFPGVSHAYQGRPFVGMLLALVSAGAIECLIFQGGPFKDPSLANVPGSLWKALAPIAVLALAWFFAWRVKVPKETWNYHILPPEMRTQEQEKKAPPFEPEPAPEPKRFQPEVAPRPAAKPEMAEAIGEIEKGSKWH
jgi:tetratricopeptide (TPR) repeat protein